MDSWKADRRVRKVTQIPSNIPKEEESQSLLEHSATKSLYNLARRSCSLGFALQIQQGAQKTHLQHLNQSTCFPYQNLSRDINHSSADPFRI